VLFIGKHVTGFHQSRDPSFLHAKRFFAADPLTEVAAIDFFGVEDEGLNHTGVQHPLYALARKLAFYLRTNPTDPIGCSLDTRPGLATDSDIKGYAPHLELINAPFRRFGRLRGWHDVSIITPVLG